ncbi:MAG: hypothetical protein EOO65_05430, partial [Methanosarcinales archaeon]
MSPLTPGFVTNVSLGSAQSPDGALLADRSPFMLKPLQGVLGSPLRLHHESSMEMPLALSVAAASPSSLEAVPAPDSARFELRQYAEQQMATSAEVFPRPAVPSQPSPQQPSRTHNGGGGSALSPLKTTALRGAASPVSTHETSVQALLRLITSLETPSHDAMKLSPQQVPETTSLCLPQHRAAAVQCTALEAVRHARRQFNAYAATQQRSAATEANVTDNAFTALMLTVASTANKLALFSSILLQRSCTRARKLLVSYQMCSTPTTVATPDESAPNEQHTPTGMAMTTVMTFTVTLLKHMVCHMRSTVSMCESDAEREQLMEWCDLVVECGEIIASVATFARSTRTAPGVNAQSLCINCCTAVMSALSPVAWAWTASSASQHQVWCERSAAVFLSVEAEWCN